MRYVPRLLQLLPYVFKIPAFISGFILFFFVFVCVVGGGPSHFASTRYASAGFDIAGMLLAALLLKHTSQAASVFRARMAKRAAVQSVSGDLKVLQRQPGMD